MRHSMIPLSSTFFGQVYRYLVHDDPWHIIAIDALFNYGLEHPQHHWYGEILEGRLIGMLYQHGQLLHFAYPQSPNKYSLLYPFIRKYIPYFITHGKKETIDEIINNVNEFGGYQVTLQEESEFIQQTPQTKRVVTESRLKLDAVQIHLAVNSDINEMLALFHGSSIESQVDRSLIFELIQQQRVMIAKKHGRIVGTVMRLKESPCYALLGGLYVQAEERGNGIATLLGQRMIQNCLYRGKKVCFYYSNPELQSFYDKADFTSIGKWVSYSASSKAMI